MLSSQQTRPPTPQEICEVSDTLTAACQELMSGVNQFCVMTSHSDDRLREDVLDRIDSFMSSYENDFKTMISAIDSFNAVANRAASGINPVQISRDLLNGTLRVATVMRAIKDRDELESLMPENIVMRACKSIVASAPGLVEDINELVFTVKNAVKQVAQMVEGDDCASENEPDDGESLGEADSDDEAAISGSLSEDDQYKLFSDESDESDGEGDEEESEESEEEKSEVNDDVSLGDLDEAEAAVGSSRLRSGKSRETASDDGSEGSSDKRTQ